MLNQTRNLVGENNPKVQLLNKSIEELELPENSVDVVVSSYTIHNIVDYSGLVSKIKEILKPDGEFIFLVIHPIYTAGVEHQWVQLNNEKAWCIKNYNVEGIRVEQTSFMIKNFKFCHRPILHTIMSDTLFTVC
ncbi:hypothetical protein PPL_07784 [Heterostelium album PN500]|uniref:Methyltransferase type 11 domain-containing protein n=1 Tax=Heterostelium pallidum (strain ATCC 26659 / Pp 5 / PN500) TaxID=670386 RepID=D3BGY2_HETP5|nr:hypothetical protein PPL_07784 [Heterostelium album PN500]EFA79366.1 hypothetical protein PPL_07784 [Heterostelium album PN500]|eukprot:XP_020431487.1 hypothetical protein PPL_07784 [Heterostelium album PN500]